MSLRSETASEGWLEEVLRIERTSFPDPWTDQAFRAEFANQWSYFRLALEEGALRGYIVCWIIPLELHVLNLAVDPGARRSGVASFLLAEALDHFSSLGGGLATLEVRRSNLAAKELYLAHGFEVVGLRPGYYQRLREDALIMSRLIAPESEHGVGGV